MFLFIKNYSDTHYIADKKITVAFQITGHLTLEP